MNLNREKIIEDVTDYLYRINFYGVNSGELLFVFSQALEITQNNFNFYTLHKNLIKVFLPRLGELNSEKLAEDLILFIRENISKYKKLEYYNNPKYSNYLYTCVDGYYEVRNHSLWRECPNCGLKPLISILNHSAKTVCGCKSGNFDYFFIRAESVASRCARSAKSNKYIESYLKDKWNHWCETGEDLFEKKKNKFKKLGIIIW